MFTVLTHLPQNTFGAGSDNEIKFGEWFTGTYFKPDNLLLISSSYVKLGVRPPNFYAIKYISIVNASFDLLHKKRKK